MVERRTVLENGTAVATGWGVGRGRSGVDVPVGTGHRGRGSRVVFTDFESVAYPGANGLEAIRVKMEDGTLPFDELETQAFDHGRQYEAEGVPRWASAKLPLRLSLHADETAKLTDYSQPTDVWVETAGPTSATNDPRDYRAPQKLRTHDRKRTHASE